MAEQITSEKQHNKKGKRPAKKSTRVDLTPMVDLGFLLITFFVFTTTMSTATAMGMVTPKENKTGTTDEICASCAITVIPAGHDSLYYYEGAEKDTTYKTTTYAADGLRKLLSGKKKAAASVNRDAILIIKPAASSSFKNLIDIIDESTIAAYKRYYLDNVSINDRKHIR